MTPQTNNKVPSASWAFLSGIIAGILTVLLGALLAHIAGQHELIAFAWLLPLLAAPVATGVVAYRLESSLGRIVSLAVLALFWAVFLMGVGEYIALYDATIGSVLSIHGWTDMHRIFWHWQLVLSVLATTMGALLGLMFGKGRPE